MTTTAKITFSLAGKTITLERELKNINFRDEFEAFLQDVDMIRRTTKTTRGQVSALYAKLLNRGWKREEIQRYLEEKLGTSNEDEIVGKVDKATFSFIIDNVSDEDKKTRT